MKYLVDVLMTVLLCRAFVAVAQEKQYSTLSLAQLNKSLVPAMVASWPQKLTEMAMKLMTKYGVPNEATDSMLVWRNNAPCKRTLSYRLEIPHEFPAPHRDFLQQVIDYRVPPDKFSELANYHGGVIVERIKGELSARCDMEELNMLALNLAHLHRKTGVEDARKYYAKTAMAFKQGKAQLYAERLDFQVHHGGTEDPDRLEAPFMASTARKTAH